MSILTIALIAPSFAADPAPAPKPSDDAAEEVVVWGDLFARWDNTRWMITNEMGLPFAMELLKDENIGFPTNQVLVKAVIGCNKEWKQGFHHYEVGCSIEDFSMRANIDRQVVLDKDIPKAQSVLDEIDAKLTGAKLQLQVADDGRVTDLSLDGVPMGTLRQNAMQETLRQVLSRLVVGFNLKLQKFNQLNEGKWQEYNSTIMSLPRPPIIDDQTGEIVGGGGGQTGSSLMVHYLNKYQGHIVVQSIGKGLDQLNIAGVDRSYTLNYIGVSLFDPDQGFMLERVWSLKGEETASSFFDSGGYYNNGRIAMLGEKDKPDVGPTQVVNGRSQSWPDLPKWKGVEE